MLYNSRLRIPWSERRERLRECDLRPIKRFALSLHLITSIPLRLRFPRSRSMGKYGMIAHYANNVGSLGSATAILSTVLFFSIIYHVQ
jgi:hypothetical protein